MATYGLPDELQDTIAKDNGRVPTSVHHAKGGVDVPPPAAASDASPSVALKDVQKHLCCALCNGLIASSLVLSCGHQYCGACLFEWLGNKPSCPNCQVPLRAIPMRCIALDGVVEAFLPALSEADIAAHKERQEEGKSAANKVNKMFWWLQPSAMPQGPPGAFGGAPSGLTPMGSGGMLTATVGGGSSCMMGGAGKQMGGVGNGHMQMMSAGNMLGGGMGGVGMSAFQSAGGAGNGKNGGMPPAGCGAGGGHHMRRASQPGLQPHQGPTGGGAQGFHSRHGGRSNSFSAGGAPPSGHQPVLPPQMAASIAAAGFPGAMQMQHGGMHGGNDMEAAYLATAQKFGMEGLALPLVLQQQMTMQAQLQQQATFLQAAAMGSHELQASDLVHSPADTAHLQSLLSGLYFA